MMSSQKLFFSYSRSDSAFALKLAKDLRDAGADIWIDQLDIPPGNHWDSAVEKALGSAGYVLVILTPASTASTNVMDEVSFALESGKKVIPVLLEDCLAPFRLRRLQRVDFINDYAVGFRQLVQTLNLTVQDASKIADPSNEPVRMQSSTPESVATRSHENAQRDNFLWEEACRINTIASYKKYLNESHTGEYKAEATLLIKQLELEQKEDELDSLLWKKAKSENSKNLYQHYLQQYPQGNYKTLALAAISDIEKEEKEEQKRIREQEKQLQKEKELRERQEKEKALREKQEREKIIQQQREQERQQQREKELREKQEKEKALQEKQERERILQQEREKQKQQEREKEKQEKEKALRERQERERIKQQEKEKALLEKRQQTEQQELPGQHAGARQKKYILIGAGVLVLCAGIWAITKLGSGEDEGNAWNATLIQNDSTAFAVYLQDYPSGKFSIQAKAKSDSLHSVQQALRDSLNAAKTAKMTAAVDPAPSSKNDPSKKPAQAAKPKSTTTAKPAPKFALGQIHQGGIVIYVNSTGEHGLIAATEDLGKLTWTVAQRKCASYRVGGFTQWRLPTQDELSLLYLNRKHLGGYTSNIYWSSTEEGKDIAWGQNFTNGSKGKFDKQSDCYVRAVHAF